MKLSIAWVYLSLLLGPFIDSLNRTPISRFCIIDQVYPEVDQMSINCDIIPLLLNNQYLNMLPAYNQIGLQSLIQMGHKL